MKKTREEIIKDINEWLEKFNKKEIEINFISIGTADFLSELKIKEEDTKCIKLSWYFDGWNSRTIEFDERFIKKIFNFIDYIKGTKITTFKYNQKEYSYYRNCRLLKLKEKNKISKMMDIIFNNAEF